jgi:hypothetical protein
VDFIPQAANKLLPDVGFTYRVPCSGEGELVGVESGWGCCIVVLLDLRVLCSVSFLLAFGVVPDQGLGGYVEYIIEID